MTICTAWITTPLVSLEKKRDGGFSREGITLPRSAKRKVARAVKNKDGMNSLEVQYSELLEELKREGSIVWWRFEPIKLRLAERTHYIPDFLVQTSNGELEVHEVKGFWMEDARVKIKVAADLFPFRFLALTPIPKSKGGGWNTERFGRGEEE